MDHDAIKFLESLPAPTPVIISRVCVGMTATAFLLGAYVVQARSRIDRANRELRHLAASHGVMSWTTPFESRSQRRA